MISVQKFVSSTWRRTASTKSGIKIPKKKTWTEGDIVNALRSTVPKPRIPIAWAEGIQYEQSFDFDRGDAGTGLKKKGGLLTKKELGVKAAEYAIKQLKTEFGHDFSKGEFGTLRDRLQNSPIEPLVARPVEDIVDANMDDFVEWINFRPIKAGIPEWVRKAFPTRELDEILLLIELLNEKDTEKSEDTKTKLIIATSVYLKQPSATLSDKMKMGKSLLNDKWLKNNTLDYTDIVSDMLDAVYFHRTFIKEEDDYAEELNRLFKSIEIPTTRLFNAYLRILPINTTYALGIQNEMRKLSLKPSPATLVAMYRHFDDDHMRLFREQIERNESLSLADSDDFYDFYAFLHLVKQLESESQADRKYRKASQKRRLVDSKDTKASEFYTRAKIYEKLIYQNPQFIPRDAFNEIFNIIKLIQIRYGDNATDVWDTFIEAPSQDFPLQAEVLSWGQSKRNMNLIAQLWQYLDASDSLRYNLNTTSNIIFFINQMSNFPVNDAEINQMCYIGKSMLQMLTDKRDIWTPEMPQSVTINKQSGALVDMCFKTLLKFDRWEPIQDYIKIEAIKPGRPDINEELLNMTFKYAVDKQITSLCDSCLYLEKTKRSLPLSEELKEIYTKYLTSQKMPLLY